MTTLFRHVCRCETAKIADLPGNLLEFHGKKEKISLHKKEPTMFGSFFITV